MFKPYQLVTVTEDGYKYTGEVMSFVTPEQTIMVRRVPGHPGTLEEMPVSKISPQTYPRKKKLYVHYANVSGRGSFPVDMLRYDFASPVNFRLVEATLGRFRAEHLANAQGDDGMLLIATVSDKPWAEDLGVWSPERWSSFLWGLEPRTHPRCALRGASGCAFRRITTNREQAWN